MKRVCLLASLWLLASPSLAQQADGLAIVASVEDTAISSLDVENRLQLVIATTRLSDSPDVRERLRPQILRSLIMETLQIQEAQRSGITVKQADINEAMASIEEQRGMQPGSLLTKLKALGVPEQTFVNQIKAQVAWSRLVMQKIRPRIKISDEELDRERIKAKNIKAAPEVQIEVLGLPVDKPESDAQVKALAEKLVAEIRRGASFESVAGELGGNASGAAQVSAVWVPVDQLDTAVATAIAPLSHGDIADPVRTLEGYTIVKLMNRREGGNAFSSITEVMVKDILLKLKNDANRTDVDASLAIGREVAKHPGSCAEKTVAGIRNLADYDIQVQFRRENQETMPAALKDIIARLPVGGVSEPYATEEGIRMFVLCERVDAPAQMADRDETFQRVMQQKLELEAQKYLRGLRRDAYIEIRQ